jgi:hypothetical protein
MYTRYWAHSLSPGAIEFLGNHCSGRITPASFEFYSRPGPYFGIGLVEGYSETEILALTCSGFVEPLQSITVVHSAWRMQGLGLTLMKLKLSILNTAGIQLYAHIAADNEASIGLITAAGLVKKGSRMLRRNGGEYKQLLFQQEDTS